MPEVPRKDAPPGPWRAGLLAALIVCAPCARAQPPDPATDTPASMPDTPALTEADHPSAAGGDAGAPQTPPAPDPTESPDVAAPPPRDPPAQHDAAPAPGARADAPAGAPAGTPASIAAPARPVDAAGSATSDGPAPPEPGPAASAHGAPDSAQSPAAARDSEASATPARTPDRPAPASAGAAARPVPPTPDGAPGADPLAGVIAGSEPQADGAPPGAQSALPVTDPDLWNADAGDAPVSPFAILGTPVLPGSQARLAWTGAESFAGIATPTPVLVAHGARRGPVLCLTAAVHGDELNGIEVVRRVYYDLRPSELRGTIVGVPIVNLPGFQRASRYLPDRRDLNRYFPGHPRGSAAGRIAHSFFNQVVLRCSALVDLHTGSLHRTNLPHVRANMADAGSWALAESFSGLPLLHDPPTSGTLREAAAARGIAAVTIEAGSPLQLESRHVRAGVRAVQSLLATLGMTGSGARPAPTGPVYESALWVRAESGGILLTAVQPGARVRAGQRLGTVADPITNARVPIVAPVDGTVLGMALDQVVMPGFATHHLGVEQADGGGARTRGPDAAPEPAPGSPAASQPAPADRAPPADPVSDPAPEGRPE